MTRRKIIIATLIMLLITTFTLSSGVFAKYISTADTTSEPARVAKWGCYISVDATEFFGQEYGGGGIDVDVGDDSLDVDAEEDTDVVFPGSSGSMTISISGTSEVYARLTVNISGTEISLGKDAQTYYPIVWTLTKDSTVLASGNLDDINAYFTDDAETSDVNELEIPPNTHSAFEGEYVLSWAWAFNNAATDIDGLSVNDADTLLGFAAIHEDERTDMQSSALVGYDAKTALSVSVSILVEQIQK